MGYYHGYKGYRFINKPVNAIPYSAFEELSAYMISMRNSEAVYKTPWFLSGTEK